MLPTEFRIGYSECYGVLYTVQLKVIPEVTRFKQKSARLFTMKSKLLLVLCLFLLLSSLSSARFGQTETKASSSFLVHNLSTGLNYTTIQDAIDANETLNGQTIRVDAGTYMEHVHVTKSLQLVGTSKESTIIDGSGTGNVIEITANNVSLCGSTVMNSGTNNSDSGILLSYVENCHISGNRITNNSIGIGINGLVTKTFDVVTENDIANNSLGIYLYTAYNTTITTNTLASNDRGIMLFASSDNTFFHNNFVEKQGTSVQLGRKRGLAQRLG